MFSVFLERIFCIFILISYTMATATSDDFKDDSLDRGAHSDRQGLWFGPRLGKRSLQLSDDDNRNTFLRLLEAADALKFYYDQLPYEMQADEPQRAAKKIIFNPKLGRAADSSPDKRTYDNVEFTPRLGRRRIPEVLPATTSEEEIYRSDPVMINPMSNLFSPRLGRNIQFSPRLGRELNYVGEGGCRPHFIPGDHLSPHEYVSRQDKGGQKCKFDEIKLNNIVQTNMKAL